MSDQLPEQIIDLLRLEEDGYLDDAALKTRVWKNVESAIILAGPPRGGGGATGGTGGAGGVTHGKLAGALVSRTLLGVVSAGTFVVGVAVGTTVPRTPTPSAGAASAPTSEVSIAPPPATESTAAAVLSASEPMASAAPALSTAASSTAEHREGDLVRERELLDVARASLGRGDPDEAIAAAARHAKKWPNGYLAEEREAIWIQSLVAAGRADEAIRRESDFEHHFPHSALLASVRSAVHSGKSTQLVTDAGGS